MPRRISDYPDAFTGWNFISSIGSIISVAATALFLHIVYLQLVAGKAIFGYPWAVPQLFSDYLRILKDRTAPGLEWALHNPPKPHAFTSLPLQSAVTQQDLENAVTEAENLRVPDTWEIAEPKKPVVEHQVNKSNIESNIDSLHRGIQNLIDQAKVEGNLSKNTLENFQQRADDATKIAKEDLHEAYEDILAGEYSNSILPFLVIGDIPVLTIVFTVLRMHSIKFFSVLNTLMLLYFNKYKSVISYIFIGLCCLFISSFILFFSFDFSVISCDAPRAWGLYFQDSASPQMEALVELHDNIMYYLVAILFAVGWIQGAIIRNFDSSRSPISNKYLNHGTLIELIWTITPIY